jgi:lysyl-tRNA synthetase class 2
MVDIHIRIASEILQKYPGARVGWLDADVVVRDESPHVEDLKAKMARVVAERGLEASTLSTHPRIDSWRKIYSAMDVKPSSYKCSLEALLRRVLKGQGLWNVSSVVDCYNCISVMSMMPMGAHDMESLDGDLELRFGRNKDVFLPLGSGEKVVQVEENHIVYADNTKICCWLWNHRDNRQCAVTPSTRRAIFIVDAAEEQYAADVGKALDMLAENLEHIGCTVRLRGILRGEAPEADLGE